MFDIKSRMRQLNSLTKYPSILTYHVMGEKGRLAEEVQVPFTGPVHLTEKVDGANTRIIIWDGDYVIGSREELLHARGDRVHNSTLGIVEHAIPVAEMLLKKQFAAGVSVFFLETFGGTLPAAKQYTSQRQVAHALFDIAVFTQEGFAEMLAWEPSKIALWRDGGGQFFLPTGTMESEASFYGLFCAPPLSHDAVLPEGLQETLDFMNRFFTPDSTGYSTTYASLGMESGRSEGLVARTHDRRLIAKLRFEDYHRTLNRR